MVKNYYQFINENKNSFSIYDFLEWTRQSWSSYVNKSELIKYTEHFIGNGQWSIIERYFDRVFRSLESVDIDYVNDRLIDIYDEYPFHDMKYAIYSVVYGDVDENISGVMSVTEISETRKLNIIVNFLNRILNNTLWIYDFKNTIATRLTSDELYVTSDKWSLKNFKHQDLDIVKNIDKMDQRIPEYKMVKFLKLKNNFSIEKCLEMYLPAIYISISTYEFMNAKISHNKIRKEFEDILPSILHDIDYSEIIWDLKLPENKEDIEIYDYNLKILLNV
jgi:hypothetical protein